jgi:hypothetical protein
MFVRPWPKHFTQIADNYSLVFYNFYSLFWHALRHKVIGIKLSGNRINVDWIQDALNVVVHHLLNADCVSKSATECPSMEINIRCLNISG